MRLSAVSCQLSALFLVACGTSAPSSPDGGPSRVLVLADPAQAQLGLRYGETVDLRVRYQLADAAQTPVAGALVKFAIFDDPGGSTLSADRDVTDDDGLASVQLTAGQQEKSFRVRATTPAAPSIEFGVTVSQLGFVNIDVQLAYGGPATIAQLVSILFVDVSCAQLHAEEKDPANAFRTVTLDDGPSGTLHFMNLLSQNYAVVGQARDAAGRVQAAGCVDVAASLVPSGATATLPLPLQAVTPTLAGTYTLTTQLALAPAPLAAARQPWHALAACTYAPAQVLLDAIEPAVPGALGSAIAAKRGAVDGTGCRPGTIVGGAPSLDAQLQSLVTAAGSPGAQLDAIVADVESLMAATTVTSSLTLTPAGTQSLTAEHALEQVLLQTPAMMKSYPVGATALPIIDVKDVKVDTKGASLALGTHGFTLGLGVFWKQATADLAIAPHLPSLQPRTSRALIGAVVGAAVRGAKTGCAAVEDLVCTSTGAASCTGAVEPACTAALDVIAAALDAPFAAPTAIDLTWSGQSTVVDSDGDQRIDQLSTGSWSTTLAQGGSAPFSGQRTP